MSISYRAHALWVKEVSIDSTRLSKAYSMINNDEMGYYLSGSYVEFYLKLKTFQPKNDSYRHISENLSYIGQDLWNIETLFLKLDWLKDLWIKGEISDNTWMTFAQTDIQLFHIEMRSIFDYLARLIRWLPFNKIRSPLSFKDLKKWVNRPENLHGFDQEISEAIQSCDWFFELKNIREGMTHFGEYSLIFPIKDRILFQVYDRSKKQIIVPEIMYNENVVDFELYGGLYFGYMLAFLDELSTLIDRKLRITPIGRDGRSVHSGLRVVKDWIEKIENLSNANL